MTKRLIFVLFVLVVVGLGSVADARDTSIRGVITKVELNSLEIRTADCQTETVTLSGRTKFIRSSTGGPILAWPAKVPQWQQAVRVDARAANIGARVRIEIDPGTPPSARTVWIAASGPR
jgi:hypothetical protein